MFTIKFTEQMGRGLYATKVIPRNTLIMRCELLVLEEQDTKIVNTTALKYYTFKYDSTRDCIVLGLGEIFNHDDNANVNYKLVDFDGRKVMEFYSVCDISSDQQLFIDYNADCLVNTQNYIKTKSAI